MWMSLDELAKATNRTVRDLTQRLQVDGWLREKHEQEDTTKQTANHRHDGHFRYGPNGPEFDSESSKKIIEVYKLPKSNRAKTNGE